MGSLLQNTIFGRTKYSFVSTWATSNISSDSSAANQIKLPLVSTGNYNFIVDWGDGSSNTITAWNDLSVTHTYATAGIYTVKIKGSCYGWSFNNTGDKLKILSISSWGKLRLGNSGSYFSGCANLNLSNVQDILDTTGTTNFTSIFLLCNALTKIKNISSWKMSKVTNLTTAFASCSNFDQDLSAWDVSNVISFIGLFEYSPKYNNEGNPNIQNWNTGNATSFSHMFDGASNFNQNIGDWDTGNVTTMEGMFLNAQKFNNGGSSGINNWNTSKVTNIAYMFSNAASFNQNIGNWNVENVSNMVSMFMNAQVFNNGGISQINSWNTSKVTNIANMFYNASSFNQNIGNWDLSNIVSIEFMFFNASMFNNGGSSEINNWNTSNLTSTIYAFYNATSFNQNIGSWNVQNVKRMDFMFTSAISFNNSGSDSINNWDTSNVNSMIYTFYNARSFNQNIGNWNLSNTTNLNNMFGAAISFNNGGSSSINNWNTSNVTNMIALFHQAISFNQPLNLWDVGNVTNMASTFQNAQSFNQNIGAWNISRVSSFDSMFQEALNFNNGGSSDINNWALKTTGTISLNAMFQGAGGDSVMRFNQPIGNWNTIAVVDMSNMFHKTGNGFHFFNQPIGNWNTSNVTNMSNMFRQGGTDGGAFNQNIGAWNVSKVRDFSGMFLGAREFNNGGSSDINNWLLGTTDSINMSQMFANINPYNLTTFNQPIGSWNTSAVTNMSQMFGATAGSVAFNQDIGNWNVSNVTDFSNFMVNKSLTNFSTSNLDAIYNGWSSRSVKTPITITFGTAKHTSASSSGKAILTSSPNNWIITDGGI